MYIYTLKECIFYYKVEAAAREKARADFENEKKELQRKMEVVISYKTYKILEQFLVTVLSSSEFKELQRKMELVIK